MTNAFLLSIAQLGDRRILAVLAKSLAATLLLLGVLGGGLVYAVHRLTGDMLGLGGGAAGIAAVAAGLIAVLAGWLLFRVVAIAVVGVFADDVVAAVEQRHYPAAAARARDVPFGQSVSMGLGSAARTIGINLLLAPLYLLLLATGVGTAILFFVVNGWLLGRDLGDMVAARHLPRAALTAERRATLLPRMLLGLAGTGLLMVPLLNFVAPVLGAAMATHLFHRRNPA